MARVRLLKRVAALVLLVSFFLPLSQCGGVDRAGNPATTKITAFSAYKWPSVGSTIATLIFVWPALLQLLALRYQRFDVLGFVFGLEMVLSVLGVFGIFWLATQVLFLGYPDYGALAAWVATLTYMLSAIAGRYVSRHPNSTAESDARKISAPARCER